MKIKKTELRKAIRDYVNYNKGGYYDPHYGIMMIDREDGMIWTDEFYSLGHNEWKEYHSKSITSLSYELSMRDIEIINRNFDIIMEVANSLIDNWNKEA